MMENKEHILKLLWICLQETRAGEDIAGMYYQAESYDSEWVHIWHRNGAHIKVCVTADSGIAMIRDVVKEMD